MRPALRGRGRGCNKASWRRSSTVPSGVWGQEAAKPSRHRDPQRPTILRLSAPSPGSGSPGFQVKDAACRVRQGKRRSRRAMQGKISSIFVDDAPQGRLRDEEERFYLRFPSSRRGLRSFTSSLSHTHRKWGSIGNRGTSADRGRQGGLPYGILRVRRGGTSTSTDCLAQGSV